jgi:hypothetical protein
MISIQKKLKKFEKKKMPCSEGTGLGYPVALLAGFVSMEGRTSLSLVRNLHLIYTSRIHWVPRGTGTPKDRDEVNRREICECDG